MMKPELVQTDNGDELLKARELIAQEIKDREQKCAEAVIQCLDEHGCQAVAMVTLFGQRVPVEALIRVPIEIGVEARRK